MIVLAHFSIFRSGRNQQVSHERPQEVSGNISPFRSWRRSEPVRWRDLWRRRGQGWRLWQWRRRRRRRERNTREFRRPIPLVQLHFHLAHLEPRQLCGRLGTRKLVLAGRNTISAWIGKKYLKRGCKIESKNVRRYPNIPNLMVWNRIKSLYFL